MEKKGKSSTRAKNKYNAKKYDRLNIVIPKGRRKTVETFATRNGDSVNGLVNNLLRNEIGYTEEEWRCSSDSDGE